MTRIRMSFHAERVDTEDAGPVFGRRVDVENADLNDVIDSLLSAVGADALVGHVRKAERERKVPLNARNRL